MNAAIFLTVRFRSTRLPGKCMMKINGVPAIETLIKRLQKTKLPIFMCATDTDDDRKYLKPIADGYGIQYEEGKEGYIYKQHFVCAVDNGVDWVLNVDGEDLLQCPEVIYRVKHMIKDTNLNVVSTVGYPFGLNVFAYRRDILAPLTGIKLNTGWGAMIKQHPYVALPYREEANHTNKYRTSVDWQEDFDLVSDVLTNCKNNETVEGILYYLDEHPEIRELNAKRRKE